MRWGASVVAGSVGMAVSQAPAAGPDWERTKARVAGVMGGNTSCSRKDVVTARKGSAVHSVFRAGLLGFIKSCVARNHHVFEMCKMFKINGEMHNFKAKIDI